ncbi:hypothetical protein JD844_005613 [Phrynosoma platyrhinos]|uniref:Membrane protein DAP10 n=1 Tax=Phrynosoma platyrhinos TaxID=52577 RepID=A0ABQ7TPG4_PHRPL|nr:hypothetical protein JD844_005613 [Phrynosoma platyrhinos]
MILCVIPHPAQASLGEALPLPDPHISVLCPEVRLVEEKAMWSFAVSVFCLLIVRTATKETGHYEDCYHITTDIMVAIVAGDILLTALLLIPVYYCTRPKDTKQSDTSK